jgi:small subunit ribosomal protein S7
MLFKNNQNQENNDSTLFFSLIFKKFISQLMKEGKKFKSETILKKVFIRVSLQGYSPVTVLTLAIGNIKPLLEVRNVCVKGKSYEVPFPIKFSRQISLSFKTILKSFTGKRVFEDFLVEELIRSSTGRSQSVKTTAALHKLASRNKLFTYFRWF